MKRTVLIVMGIAVALFACALFAVSCHSSNGSDANKPLFELLHEAGYQGADESWVDLLSDEQMAAIDIAYESDVASGYQGTREEWVSGKLVAHYDSNGGIVVVMPDGGEFTLPADVVSRVGAGDAASDERSTSGGVDGSTAKSPGNEEAEQGSESSDGAGGEASEDANGSATEDVFGAQVSVDSVQARPGDANIAVAVRIEHNPGILGATLSVSYDESVLTLRSAENGEAFKDALSLTRSKDYRTGCLFTWDGVDLSPSDVKDGVVLTLYFDVAKDAAPGIYPVAVRTSGSVVNSDLQEVGVSIQDGSVVIERA